MFDGVEHCAIICDSSSCSSRHSCSFAMPNPCASCGRHCSRPGHCVWCNVSRLGAHGTIDPTRDPPHANPNHPAALQRFAERLGRSLTAREWTSCNYFSFLAPSPWSARTHTHIPETALNLNYNEVATLCERTWRLEHRSKLDNILPFRI